MSNCFYTIGYAGYPDFSGFLNVLKAEGVNLLVDVRSSPYSGYFVQYNREKLESALWGEGIYYRNYAREFGARQTERKYYTNGDDSFLDFELFSKSNAFQSGVSKMIKNFTAGYTPVFLCAEKNPITCHRAIMVSRAFSDLGYPVIHLLPNGLTETQADLESELLAMYFKEQPQEEEQCIIEGFNLNQVSTATEPELSKEEKIRQAYHRQNAKIGYKWRDIIS